MNKSLQVSCYAVTFVTALYAGMFFAFLISSEQDTLQNQFPGQPLPAVLLFFIKNPDVAYYLFLYPWLGFIGLPLISSLTSYWETDGFLLRFSLFLPVEIFLIIFTATACIWSLSQQRDLFQRHAESGWEAGRRRPGLGRFHDLRSISAAIGPEVATVLLKNCCSCSRRLSRFLALVTGAGAAGEHPQVVDKHGPGDHEFAVGKAFAAQGLAEELAFEDGDARLGLGAAFLPGRELRLLEPAFHLTRIFRTKTVLDADEGEAFDIVFAVAAPGR